MDAQRVDTISELLATDPRTYRYTRGELLILDRELGGLSGIAQRLGMSGVGDVWLLIAAITDRQA